MAIALGCGGKLPPPSGSPYDATYRKQRMARQDYTETAIIQACPESSTRCSPAAAELEHHFESGDRESVFVTRIQLQGGTDIHFNDARMPGRGTDTDEQAWDLKW